MNQDRWHQITEIFHAAIARDPDRRRAFVAEACGAETELRDQIQAMVTAHERAGRFGDKPIVPLPPALESGTMIAGYRIDCLIGAGGMGEIYRAADTRLGRDVAIKMLPLEWTDIQDRVARLRNEAHVLASLSHPNIAAIYGIEETGSAVALVLELIDGLPLPAHLAASRPAAGEVLRLAAQIADALSAAHARGIIHRDLKPSNIMITRTGVVKVLDFGLAKVSPSALLSPDHTPNVTLDGAIVGTPAYISPEQARGGPVGKQTDIWAFGCVLYEMLCGEPAFAGDTPTDILAAVIERDPDWSRLPQLPASLHALLRRCLQKNVDERLRDIGDAGLAIADALAEASTIRVAREERRWPRYAAAAILITFLTVAAVAWFNRPAPSSIGLIEFSIPLAGFTPGYGLDVSPDGSRIAIGGLVAGRAQIWLQTLDGSHGASLLPADVGVAPFWSPDGSRLAFISQGQLWSVGPGQGPPVSLCSAPGRGSGSWSRGNQIIFAAAGQLFHVTAAGGEPRRIDVADRSGDRGVRIWPHFLPDGRHFTYHVSSPVEQAVYLGSLDDPLVTKLIDSPFPAKIAEPEFLLFLRGTSLMAQRLDLRARALTGDAVVIAQDAVPGYLNALPSFSVSRNGVLAFMPTRTGTRGELAWFDRDGRVLGQVAAPERVEYLNPVFSPTGHAFAVNRMDPQTGNWDIWTLDSHHGRPTRRTDHAAIDADPVWSPDGESIVFTSNRGHQLGLYRKSVGASTPEEQLLSFDASIYLARATDWSRDGGFIIYETQDQARGPMSIFALPLGDDRRPIPLVQSRFGNYGAVVSPNGQWLAYSSNDDGAFATYVQRFAGGGQRNRISDPGAVHPRWTDNGRSIAFWSEPGGVLSVDVAETGEGLVARNLKTLVGKRIATLLDGRPHFAVAPDGRRFLLRQSVGQTDSAIRVVVNWSAKLARE